MSEPVRLQKFLAAAGVSSRRRAEELITAGRVKVNSKVVTELGTKVDASRDVVTVDGTLVSASESRAYYLLYKPSGCVTTASDPEGRPTALDYLHNVRERVFSVGRLDYDAEGAVLFTDDGELANRLAHPRYGHRRTYLVKVKGEPEPQQLMRMIAGVRLEDGPAQALEANVHEHAEKNVWIRVVVGEGRFHLVKRLCESVGLQVQRLFRPEFGGITVAGLRVGHYRPLGPNEIRQVRRLVGLEGGEPEAQKALPRSLLPKAARRHGHGPPTPPGARPAEEPAEHDELEGREGREESPQGTGRPERGERPPLAGRPSRQERPQRGGRPGQRERPGQGQARPQHGERPERPAREARRGKGSGEGPRPKWTKRAERAGEPPRPGSGGQGGRSRGGGRSPPRSRGGR